MTDLHEIHDLIHKILNGDKDAFGIIVREYTTMVAAMVVRYARNEIDREDLAQEVFIRAYRALSKYRGTGSFEGWLRKIAVHACLDWLRKKKRAESVALAEMDKEKGTWFDAEIEDINNPQSEEILNSNEALEILQKAMESLSPEDNLVIVLKEIEGRSINEISHMTGWSETNVKVRAHRARERLKTILINQGVLR